MKWLAVVWRSLVVVWSRAVDELALCRPCAPCPPLRNPSPVSQSHCPMIPLQNPPQTLPILSLSSFSSLYPLSFPPFQRPSLLYLFFSTIITLPRTSAASLAASLAGPDLHPRAALFYNCFPWYLSILFTAVTFTRPPTWRSYPTRLKLRWILMRQTSGCPRGDKLREELKRLLVELNPLHC